MQTSWYGLLFQQWCHGVTEYKLPYFTRSIITVPIPMLASPKMNTTAKINGPLSLCIACAQMHALLTFDTYDFVRPCQSLQPVARGDSLAFQISEQ